MNKLNKKIVTILTVGTLTATLGLANAQNRPANEDTAPDAPDAASETATPATDEAAAPVQTQTPAASVVNLGQQAEQRIVALTNALELNEDQVRDIGEIVSQEVKELSELIANEDLSAAERQAEIIEVRQTYGEKIAEELNENQRADYKNMLDAEIGAVKKSSARENNIR